MIAIFPMKYVRITQAWGPKTLTHKYGYPIDNAGKDTGIDNCYAPFDGVIKKIYKNGNSVWLESVEPIEWANGVKDHVVFMATHDNNVSDLRVGQIVKQGQTFYQEGTNNAVGNHVHIEFGRGKYLPEGWYQAPNGQWVIKNPAKPTDIVYITDSNVIIQTSGLKFKEANMAEKVTLNTARILAYGILGRNGVTNKTNALTGASDADLVKNHVGKSLTNSYIGSLYNSNEAKAFRNELPKYTKSKFTKVTEQLYRENK